MAFTSNSGGGPMAEINVTPLVDVMLVLLIIFMITAPLMSHKIRIGASGNAGIETVAGPVGEALIMTALGLGVAIPAVLAYNIFIRANRVTNAQFDEFAHDLHDFFATGARVDTGAAATLVAPKPTTGAVRK